MGAITAEPRRAREPNLSYGAARDATSAHVLEQARDFGQLFAEALDDALNALTHGSPEQYLQFVAAHKREAAREKRQTRQILGLRERGGPVAVRNEAVVQDLRTHLAFEILQTARRYANFLASIGDYASAEANAGCRAPHHEMPVGHNHAPG